MKTLCIVLVSLVSFGLIALLISGCTAFTPAIRDKSGITVPGSIARLEKINLGGLDQWISIRSSSPSNPVLLFVHGGPGASQMGAFRKDFPALEMEFTVVAWDQRGAGKSYSPKIPVESMTWGQIIQDGLQLTEILRARFGQDKIYLTAHSFGTYAAIKMVAAKPEYFKAYVGMNQAVYQAEAEVCSYAYCLRKAEETGNKKAMKDLARIGPPVDGCYKRPYDDLGVERKWLSEFGGVSADKNFMIKWGPKNVFTEEYTLKDAFGFISGMEFSIKSLWSEGVNEDFRKSIPAIAIPVYLIGGDLDQVTPVALMESYLSILDAPVKKLFVIAGTGHTSIFERPREYERIMFEVKRSVEAM